MRYGSFNHQVVPLYYLYDTCYPCILAVNVIFVPSWYMLSLYPYGTCYLCILIVMSSIYRVVFRLPIACIVLVLSLLFFLSFFFLFLLLLLEATSGMQQKKCQIYCYFVFRVHVCRYALFTFALPVACLPKMSVVYISVSEM